MSTLTNLKADFDAGKITSQGCISIWQSEAGKPGDNFYRINGLHIQGNTLIILLEGDTTIEVMQPEGIDYSAGPIKVMNAKKIHWKGPAREVVFENLGEMIKSEVLKGQLPIAAKKSGNAFEMYSW